MLSGNRSLWSLPRFSFGECPSQIQAMPHRQDADVLQNLVALGARKVREVAIAQLRTFEERPISLKARLQHRLLQPAHVGKSSKLKAAITPETSVLPKNLLAFVETCLALLKRTKATQLMESHHGLLNLQNQRDIRPRACFCFFLGVTLRRADYHAFQSCTILPCTVICISPSLALCSWFGKSCSAMLHQKTTVYEPSSKSAIISAMLRRKAFCVCCVAVYKVQHF